MHWFERECAELAARARGGDAAALAGLRRKLEPQMPVLVRRVLRRGSAATPFERQVLHAARQAEHYAGGPGTADRERLVGRVSSSVLEGLLAGLGAAPPASQRLKETVRM